jgi:hypothetical protein
MMSEVVYDEDAPFFAQDFLTATNALKMCQRVGSILRVNPHFGAHGYRCERIRNIMNAE